MKDFDPKKSGQEVFDELNDLWYEWNPDWANSWRQSATPNEPDGSTMLWDGDIIAGWRPLRRSGRPSPSAMGHRPAVSLCEAA